MARLPTREVGACHSSTATAQRTKTWLESGEWASECSEQEELENSPWGVVWVIDKALRRQPTKKKKNLSHFYTSTSFA